MYIFVKCLAMSPPDLAAALAASALSEIAWNCFVSRSTRHAWASTRAAMASLTPKYWADTGVVYATNAQTSRKHFMVPPLIQPVMFSYPSIPTHFRWEMNNFRIGLIVFFVMLFVQRAFLPEYHMCTFCSCYSCIIGQYYNALDGYPLRGNHPCARFLWNIGKWF